MLSIKKVRACRNRVLPEGPHAVHHAMVNPEGWVARGGEEIAARIATVPNVRIFFRYATTWVD